MDSEDIEYINYKTNSNFSKNDIQIIEDIMVYCEDNPLHIVFERADMDNNIEFLEKIYSLEVFRNYCNNHYEMTKSIFKYPNWDKILKNKNKNT
jgi:hypothetical protein